LLYVIIVTIFRVYRVTGQVTHVEYRQIFDLILINYTNKLNIKNWEHCQKNWPPEWPFLPDGLLCT